MITHVYFDLGLTLLENNLCENIRDCLVKTGNNYSLDTVKLAYHYSNKYFMREHQGLMSRGGEEFFKRYIGDIINRVDNRISFDVFFEVFKTYEKPEWRKFEFTDKVLDELASKGIEIGLISNWSVDCRELLNKLGLADKLSTITISDEEGIEKPEKKIFDIALAKANAKPENTLYVGDNYYDDYVGSSKCGIKCLIINPYNKEGIEELSHPYIISDIREVIDYIEEY